MASVDEELAKLLTDSGAVFVSRVVTYVIGFVVHALLVRKLEPMDFGIFSLSLTIVSVAAGIGMFGMDQTVARYIGGSEQESASKYVVAGLGTVLLVSPLLSVALLLSSNILEGVFASPGLADTLTALVVLIVLRPVAGIVSGTVRGFKKTTWKVVYNDLLPSIIGFIFLVILVSMGRPLLAGILFYVVRAVARISLQSARMLVWSSNTISFELPTWDTASETLSFTWPLAIQKLVTVFLGSIDILMLGWFLTSEKVAYYRSVQPVAATIIFILGSMTFIYLPMAAEYFVNNQTSRLEQLYNTTTNWVTQATFPFVAFYILFGNQIIEIVFVKEYTVAWGVLIILTLGMYSRVLAGPNGMTIKAIDRTREDLIASVGALGTNIVLNVLLIPYFGINGAAMATAASYIVYNLLDLYIIHRYAGIFPIQSRNLKPLILTSGILVPVSIFLNSMRLSIYELAVVGILITALHFVSVYLTIGFSREDRAVFNAIISS